MTELKQNEKEKEYKFDKKDKMILNLLQENYRISYQELHKKVGLAASTIHNRVQNMVEFGIIRNFDTVVCPLKVGYDSVAILGLSVDHEKVNDGEIAERLSSFNEVQLAATSTGDHDIILQVYAINEDEMWRFIKDKIKTIDGVSSKIHVSKFIDIKKMSHKIIFNTK